MYVAVSVIPLPNAERLVNEERLTLPALKSLPLTSPSLITKAFLRTTSCPSCVPVPSPIINVAPATLSFQVPNVIGASPLKPLPIAILN